jgi:hypothetical protein
MPLGEGGSDPHVFFSLHRGKVLARPCFFYYIVPPLLKMVGSQGKALRGLFRLVLGRFRENCLCAIPIILALSARNRTPLRTQCDEKNRRDNIGQFCSVFWVIWLIFSTF